MGTVNAVLLDTDVFGALYVTPREVVLKQGHPVGAWESSLTGCRPLISFQTRAEILSGAYLAGWGEKRLTATLARLDGTPTIHVDRDIVEAYARLLAEAKKAGHALGILREHVGDRWIAACAIAKGLPLLTGNRRHFTNAPRLLLHEVPDA